ncbi:hypothetical protein C0581_05070 [Candidatus Parcubacteria bacterium]|nr:MAG: hypothetical protein C0581_05070 [Candidatus Parcubacteria bacterium]
MTSKDVVVTITIGDAEGDQGIKVSGDVHLTHNVANRALNLFASTMLHALGESSMLARNFWSAISNLASTVRK